MPATSMLVVVNDLEQYSLWPSSRALPGGWHPEGFDGSTEDCLAHIERVWTQVAPPPTSVAPMRNPFAASSPVLSAP